MSDQIVQTLGFDATAALASLSQLDGGLATLEGHLQRTATLMRDFNAAGNQTSSLLSRLATNATKAATAFSAIGGTSNISAAATSFANLGSAVNNAAAQVTTGSAQIRAATSASADATASNIGKMTTSFQLLSRIVFTQAVIRALSSLRNTLRDVGGEAVSFQNKIALVRTIDNSGQSFEALSSSVRSLSDQFNIPLLQAASGLYQTISNQVGDATQSLQFLTETAKFAKATDSTLQDSVDLLSGAMKSFGKDVDDTGKIASIFFKTIDLGRVTADKLSNSFGRVGPQAGELGLSLEEVGAAIAAISIKGSNSNEALTQFRNILVALVKPTEAMKQALNDIGFTSAGSAIKTLGFTGVLKALADSTNGSDEAMAKLFPNVRGLSGAIALTSDNLKTMSANLEEMQALLSRTNTDKFLQATSTDAQRVTSDINKLKNALTVDLGQAFLKFGVQLSDAVGGVDKFVEVIRVAPTTVAGLATSLLSLAVAAKAAAVAGGSISGAFGLALLAPAALGLGKSLGQAFDDAVFTANFRQLGELIRADADAMQTLRDSAKETLDAATDDDAERIKSARLAALEIVRAYSEANEEAINANKRLVKGLKSDADDIIGAYQRLSTAIGSALAESQRSQQQSAARIQSLQNEQAKAALQSQLTHLNDSQKVFALSQQSAQLSAQAARQIATSAGNETLTARGRQQADLAKQLIDQEIALAQQTGNRTLVSKAASDAVQFFKNQQAAEQQLSQAESVRQVTLDKQRQSVEAITGALREQFTILLENSGALDKQGNAFSAAEQAQRQAARESATQRISQLALSSADTKQLANLGLTAAIAKLNSDLTKAPIKIGFDAAAGTARIQEQLTQAFANFRVKLQFETGINASNLESVLGTQFKNPDQIFQGAEQVAKRAAEIRKQLSDSELAAETIGRLQNQFQQLAAGPQARAAGPTGFGASPEALASLRSLVTLLTEIADQSNITTADLQAAEARVAGFTEVARSQFDSRLAFNTTNDALELMIGKLKELADAQKNSLDPTEAAQLRVQLLQLQGVLGSLNANNVGQQFQQGATALQSATGPASTIASHAESANKSLQQGAQAWIKASEASFQTPGAQAQGFAHGGLVRYFADGGFTPRGTDTIPAMLSPGEFIVNAASTRKFYAQLVAINSGRQPIYRAEGGPVQQTFNFGDINLTNDGQRSSARDFVRDVRRELRRTTSKL